MDNTNKGDASTEASSLFFFKQFALEQSNLASMKLNTDGLCLAAWVDCSKQKKLLDIGTGTGSIALVLAQRYAQAHIEALEIHEFTAALAAKNFANSPWPNRLHCYAQALQRFDTSQGFEHCISNPPYYDASAHIPVRNAKSRQEARQSWQLSFEDILRDCQRLGSPQVQLSLILPVPESKAFEKLALATNWHLHKELYLATRPQKKARRRLMTWGRTEVSSPQSETQYTMLAGNDPKAYSPWYRSLLSDLLIIF